MSPVRLQLRAMDSPERLRIERVLSTARACLAVVSLIAVWFDATEPTHFAALTYSLLTVYSITSVALVFVTRAMRKITPRFSMVVHATDIIWPALITTFTSGPSSPFFSLALFSLLAAAYRWGLRETLATAGVNVLAIVAQSVTWNALGWIGGADFPLNRLIVRTSYFFISAFLVGYLAEEEKQRRGEATATARLARYARVDDGLRMSLQFIVADIMQLFGASRVELVVRDEASGTTVSWRVDRDRPERLDVAELPPNSDVPALSPDVPPALYASGRERGGKPDATVGLNAAGSRIDIANPEAVAALLYVCGGRSFVSVAYSAGGGLATRLVLTDPLVGDPESDLRFLQMLVQATAPALHNVYSYGRFRSRIGAAERARLARELHDGVIQSIIAAEMDVAVLRRDVSDDQPMGAGLRRVQGLLREQTIALRELMQRMKPLDLDKRNLVEFLTVTVERFRRDTNISASFVTSLRDIALPPRVAREAGRIVQEALSNIRRHSGAQSAFVRLRADDDTVTLLIDDDGHGFEFTGRLEGEALDRGGRGPLTIIERAHAMGAALAVESTPGSGSRIELKIPRPRRSQA